MAAAKRSGGKRHNIGYHDDGMGDGDFLGDDDTGDDSLGDDGGGDGGGDTGGDTGDWLGDDTGDGLGDDTGGGDTTGDDTSTDDTTGDDTTGDDTTGDDTSGDDTTGGDDSTGDPWADGWGPGGMHPNDGDDAGLDSLVDYLLGDDSLGDPGDPFDGLFDDSLDDGDDDGDDDGWDDDGLNQPNITVDSPCVIVLDSTNQNALDRLDSFTSILAGATGDTAQYLAGWAWDLYGYFSDISNAFSGDLYGQIIDGIEGILEAIASRMGIGTTLQQNFNRERAGWLNALNQAYNELLDQSTIDTLSAVQAMNGGMLPVPCQQVLDTLTGGFGGLDGILADGGDGGDDYAGVAKPLQPNGGTFVPISAVAIPSVPKALRASRATLLRSPDVVPPSSTRIVGNVPVVIQRKKKPGSLSGASFNGPLPVM